MRALLQKFYLAMLMRSLPYQDAHTYRRIFLLHVTLISMTLIFSTFAILNLLLFQQPLLSLLDFIGASGSAMLYVRLRRTKHLYSTLHATIISLFALSLLFVYMNQNSQFGLFWSFLFPVVTITLLGHRQGLKVTILFYLVVFALAISGFHQWHDGAWNLEAFLRFAIASIALTYAIVLNEISLERALYNERKAMTNLRKVVRTDSLTQIPNRRCAANTLKDEIERAKKQSHPLSIALFDIDDFKRINDDFGHNTGDIVLKEVATLIKDALDTPQYIGRWGGEEFLVIFPQQSLDDAAQTAAELCQLIAHHTFSHQQTVTASFGLSAFRVHLTQDRFIAEADQALYEAKHHGKNRVEVYQEAPNLAFGFDDVFSDKPSQE